MGCEVHVALPLPLLSLTYLDKFGLASVGEVVEEAGGVDDEVVDQEEGLLDGDAFDLTEIHHQPCIVCTAAWGGHHVHVLPLWTGSQTGEGGGKCTGL